MKEVKSQKTQVRRKGLIKMVSNTCLGAVILLSAVVTLAGLPRMAFAQGNQVSVRADFNGDGFTDLAVGVIGERVGSLDDAGAVNVIYGTSSGLSSAGNQFFTQNTPGIHDGAEVGDDFGEALIQ